jgi:deaminated glutathione amidase
MKIAIIQPDYPSAGTRTSADSCMHWMQEQLARCQPGEQDLVLLPEYANAPGLNDRESLQACVVNEGAAFLESLAASARRLGCLLAVGTVAADQTAWFNRTLVYDETGTAVFAYDKIHLTAYESDQLGLSAGSGPAVWRHHLLCFGFATCFDFYFAEHFSALAAQQVDLILGPSYQRSESVERIRMIAQTRALDTGAYVLRCSYAMNRDDVGGCSLVASPEGTLLADGGSAPGVIRVKIDPTAKFFKAASHGQPPIEHRALIESRRRPKTYRQN